MHDNEHDPDDDIIGCHVDCPLHAELEKDYPRDYIQTLEHYEEKFERTSGQIDPNEQDLCQLLRNQALQVSSSEFTKFILGFLKEQLSENDCQELVDKMISKNIIQSPPNIECDFRNQPKPHKDFLELDIFLEKAQKYVCEEYHRKKTNRVEELGPQVALDRIRGIMHTLLALSYWSSKKDADKYLLNKWRVAFMVGHRLARLQGLSGVHYDLGLIKFHRQLSVSLERLERTEVPTHVQELYLEACRLAETLWQRGSEMLHHEMAKFLTGKRYERENPDKVKKRVNRQNKNVKDLEKLSRNVEKFYELSYRELKKLLVPIAREYGKYYNTRKDEED